MTIFDQIDHNCMIRREQIPPRKARDSLKLKLKRWWFSLVQVSPVHSLTIRFFSTESQLRRERKRHYDSAHFFTVHPLSKLAVLREAYLSLFYIVVIFFRLMELAFIRRSRMHQPDYVPYLYIVTVIDVLSWLNLVCMCFEGVIVKKTKLIVIDLKEILRYRIRSFFFWCEMLSSVPKFIICPYKAACVRSFWLFLTCLRLFAVCLFYRPVHLLRNTLAFFKIESRTVRIHVSTIYLISFVTHLMACSEFAMARYRYLWVGFKDNKTWIVRSNLINRDLKTQYFYSFYIATAQTFGVYIDKFDENASWEESFLSVLNYITGKIMLLMMWVVNLHVLLSQDFCNAKYQMLLSQLKTWMDFKELPRDLQKRITNYYNHYYRRNTFNKKSIEHHMPREVFRKVRVNMHRALKESKGGRLSQISDHAIQKIGEHTTTEYFSPADVIVPSGIKLPVVYLLASGSVAVYSRSGTEVYHLYDGAYVGDLDIMLPDQNISGSVIALEATKMYRIEKEYFQRYIISKKEYYDIFLHDAIDKFNTIKRVEEKYRKSMSFERMKKVSN